MNELHAQHITAYKVWDGIIDNERPCRGISLAHKQIVVNAKERGLKEVIICEDDIKFSAPGAYAFFLQNRPADFDIYLAGVTHGKLNENNIVKDFSGLTLYIVHERFYDVFLSINENEHLDRGLKNKGRYAVCNPFTVTQYNGYSDNEKRYCDYSFYLSESALFKG